MIQQWETRVTRNGERLNDFTIILYDENGDVVNFVTTADYGSGLGYCARIRDPEYNFMRGWAVFEPHQVIGWDNVIGLPLVSWGITPVFEDGSDDSDDIPELFASEDSDDDTDDEAAGIDNDNPDDNNRNNNSQGDNSRRSSGRSNTSFFAAPIASATGTAITTPVASSGITTEYRFKQTYSNNIMVVNHGQRCSSEQPVTITAKIDTELNTENLVFYTFDRETNTVRRTARVNYIIGSDGYIRFDTKLADDIIITDKPLTRK
jgi:hypothetical protein